MSELESPQTFAVRLFEPRAAGQIEVAMLKHYTAAVRAAAIEECAQWLRDQAKHYPPGIFIEPEPGQHGRTVDACSASMARHICKAWPGAMVRALAEPQEDKHRE